MGSVIDRVQELAADMGTFTTRQMAFRAYGAVDMKAVTCAGDKLRRLANQGYVERVDKIEVDGRLVYRWRAVQ